MAYRIGWRTLAFAWVGFVPLVAQAGEASAPEVRLDDAAQARYRAGDWAEAARLWEEIVELELRRDAPAPDALTDASIHAALAFRRDAASSGDDAGYARALAVLTVARWTLLKAELEDVTPWVVRLDALTTSIEHELKIGPAAPFDAAARSPRVDHALSGRSLTGIGVVALSLGGIALGTATLAAVNVGDRGTDDAGSLAFLTVSASTSVVLLTSGVVCVTIGRGRSEQERRRMAFAPTGTGMTLAGTF